MTLPRLHGVAAMALGILCAAGVLAGCGGGNDPSAAKTPAKPKAEALKQVCPEVEKALSPYPFGPIKLKDLQRFQGDLTPIYGHADLEAQNAVTILRRAATRSIVAYSDTAEILPGLTASQNMDDAVSEFAHRCKAAGSSALQ